MSNDVSTELNGTTDSYLLLEDGSVFLGKRFGADVSVDGEIGKSIGVSRTRAPYTSRSRMCARTSCL